MSNAEDLLAHTQTLFRELRAAWFEEVISEHGWFDMTAAEESALEAQNDALRKEYDAQTERLLQGEPLSVYPYCEWDMEGSDAGNQEKS